MPLYAFYRFGLRYRLGLVRIYSFWIISFDFNPNPNSLQISIPKPHAIVTAKRTATALYIYQNWTVLLMMKNFLYPRDISSYRTVSHVINSNSKWIFFNRSTILWNNDNATFYNYVNSFHCCITVNHTLIISRFRYPPTISCRSLFAMCARPRTVNCTLQ